MRRELADLFTIDTPDDWAAVELRSPRLPETSPRTPVGQRIAVAVVALLIAGASIGWLVAASQRSKPADNGPSPTPTVTTQPLGAEGTLLYPETDPAAYVQLQQ